VGWVYTSFNDSVHPIPSLEGVFDVITNGQQTTMAEVCVNLPMFVPILLDFLISFFLFLPPTFVPHYGTG